MKDRLLIIGAGMATAYLLAELGSRAHDMDITVVGDEAEACYNRVLLSNVLSGENTGQDLLMLDASSASVSFITGTRIDRIDPVARQAVDSNGATYSYDRLVFATGSSVARPAVDCEGIGGIEAFRTLADTRLLRGMDSRGVRALVVGGGLLGLEAAHGLNELGFDTTVLHRNRVIMNRQLDAAGGLQLQAELEQRGIGFCLGASISEVRSARGKVTGVELDDGRALPCELLLFATGIAPNTGLATGAGIDCSRGIAVDAHLRTSAPEVYAIGECCQFGKHGFGLVAPIREQAKVLAQTFCAEDGPGFRIEDYPTQLKISGIDIYRAGELDDSAEQLVLRDETRGLYRRLVIRNNKLIGAVLVGDKRGGTWYSELIETGRNIGNLRSALMFGRETAESLLADAA